MNKQYNSLVAQTVKTSPAMWETWVRALGRKDPLEEGMATHSSIPAWRIPMDRGAGQATVHGVSESDTTERLSTAQQKEGVGFVRDGGYTSECTRQDPS